MEPDLPGRLSTSWRGIRDEIPFVGLVLLVFLLIGHALGWPWTGYPKGDDPLVWINMAKMLAKDPRYYLWSPDQYLGWRPFSVISPIVYSLIAALTKLSFGDVVEVFQAFFAVSVLATGLSMYALARITGVPRLLSVGVAGLLWVTPSYWSLSIGGGAYDRALYFPLIFLSTIAVYSQIRSINSENAHLGTHFFALLALALVAASDLYDFLASLFFLVPLYLVGIRGIRRATSWFLKMFLAVAAIDSWFLIPSAESIYQRTIQGGFLSHYSVPNPTSWLFWPGGYSLQYTHSLNPLLIPLAACGVMLAFLGGQVVKTDRQNSGLFFGAAISTVYFGLTGWTYIPPQYRLMASYDSGDWIAVSLIVLGIVGLGVFFRARHRPRISQWSGLFLILALLATGIVFVPKLVPVSNELADSSLVPVGDALLRYCDGQYRVAGVTARVFNRYITYEFPSLQLTGGRFAYYTESPYYVNWAADRVFFRADESIVPSVYIDDRPIYTRANYGGMANWYSSLYWLDWFGARSIVFVPREVPVRSTQLGYLERGQFFNASILATSYGPVSTIQNNDASPITVATNSTIAAVLADNCPLEPCYFNVLDSLSYLGLDSRYVIPVQLSSASDLASSRVDVLLAEGSAILANQYVQSYLKSGGRVVVFNASSTNDSRTSQLSADNVGSGSVVYANCSLSELDSAGVAGSIVLAKLVLGSGQMVAQPLQINQSHDGFTQMLQLYSPSVIDPRTRGAIKFTLNGSSGLPLSLVVKAEPGDTTAEVTTAPNGEAIVPFASFPFDSDTVGFRTLDIYVRAGNLSASVVGHLTITSASLLEYRPAAFIQVNGTWTGPNVYDVSSIPTSYKALLWKETWTPDWTVLYGSEGSSYAVNQSNSSAGSASARITDYFYAGPGLIYLPLGGTTSPRENAHLEFTQNATRSQICGWIISAIAVAVVATLGLRKRLGIRFLRQYSPTRP